MEDQVDAILREASSQQVPVLLRVTCRNGYWKGAAHYHHILPPPEGAGRAWFDREGFLKRTKSPRGIVRVAKSCLLSDRARIDEDMQGLFGDVMAGLRDIYDEDMVKTGDWVALRCDFDGGLVGSFLLVWCLGTCIFVWQDC